MGLGEINQKNQQTMDELSSEPDTQPIYKIKSETVKVILSPEKVVHDSIGNSWIVGSSTNGLVGTNTGTQGGGQQVVGGDGRVETVHRVRSINKRAFEFFNFNTFEETTAPSTELLETFTDTQNGHTDPIYGATWIAQTFTIGNTGNNGTFNLDTVEIKSYRVGLPGTITVAIKAVDGNGEPTGADLSTGTIDGDTFTTSSTASFESISMSAVELQADTKYALIVKALSGTVSKYIRWKYQVGTPSYTGGNFVSSLDSGSTWNSTTIIDLLFNVYGTSVYTTTGDWGSGALVLTSGETATSTSVAYNDGTISKATITVVASSGDISDLSFQLTADGGTNWESVSHATQNTFTTTGTDLRWFVSSSGSVTLTLVKVQYG